MTGALIVKKSSSSSLCSSPIRLIEEAGVLPSLHGRLFLDCRVASGSRAAHDPAGRGYHHKDWSRLEKIEHAVPLSGTTIIISTRNVLFLQEAKSQNSHKGCVGWVRGNVHPSIHWGQKSADRKKKLNSEGNNLIPIWCGGLIWKGWMHNPLCWQYCCSTNQIIQCTSLIGASPDVLLWDVLQVYTWMLAVLFADNMTGQTRWWNRYKLYKVWYVTKSSARRLQLRSGRLYYKPN